MASSDRSPDADEREVFAGLPNARPHRRSAKRDRPARGAASTPRPKAAKASAAAKPKAKPAAKVPPAGYATPGAHDDAPRGADLLGTAVRAAGELAQIGIAAGGHALKSVIQRLPRP
jgi:hypothetical protein